MAKKEKIAFGRLDLLRNDRLPKNKKIRIGGLVKKNSGKISIRGTSNSRGPETKQKCPCPVPLCD